MSATTPCELVLLQTCVRHLTNDSHPQITSSKCQKVEFIGNCPQPNSHREWEGFCLWMNGLIDNFLQFVTYLVVPDWATKNSNTWSVLSLKTQKRLNMSSKKPEKLLLLKPKLELQQQNLSMIHVLTRRIKTRWNSNSIKSELHLALILSSW